MKTWKQGIICILAVIAFVFTFTVCDSNGGGDGTGLGKGSGTYPETGQGTDSEGGSENTLEAKLALLETNAESNTTYNYRSKRR